MFALARNVASAHASMKAGKWESGKFIGAQLQHKTLGIVGLGQVGSHVAKVCREIGMNLVCYDPYVNAAKAESLGCRILSLEELLTISDVVTLHVPLVDDTVNLINSDRLKLMKSSSLLINCSRGGVVDEQALCQALCEGKLAGAALGMAT